MFNLSFIEACNTGKKFMDEDEMVYDWLPLEGVEGRFLHIQPYETESFTPVTRIHISLVTGKYRLVDDTVR